MAYNPAMYFPQTYQPIYQPIQQTQQTKYVEVIPVDTVEEASACPMAAGSSFLFFARDDSFIAVKNSGVNGQTSFTVYDKRPPAPSAPPFDPSVYVTKDEFESRLAALQRPTRAKKEAAEE